MACLLWCGPLASANGRRPSDSTGRASLTSARRSAEELDELDQALQTSNQRASADVIEEFGDLLVALVN